MNSFRAAIQSGKVGRAEDPLVRGKESRGAHAESLGSVSIPRDEERLANHREEDRHRLTAETATARHHGTDYIVEIINLSGGGAMISGSLQPKLWDRVDLMLGEGAAIEGAVRWLRNDRIGLEFAHETRIECDPDIRDALLLEVIRRSFPDVRAMPTRQAVTVGAVAGTNAGKRGDIRHPLIWSGQIHYAHDSHRVRLRNVSAGGALVEVATVYPVDAEVLLDLGDAGQFFATVSWLHGDQAGLRFAEPFDVACLAKAKPEMLQPKWAKPAYLELPDSGSPWDKEWSRSSLEDIRTDLEGYLKY